MVVGFRRTMRRHLVETVLAWVAVMQVDTLSAHGALVRSRDSRYLERAIVCHHSPFRTCNRRMGLQTLARSVSIDAVWIDVCGLMSVG